MAAPPARDLKQLARTILKDANPNARKEALLEIRRHDHPRLLDVLERAATQDSDAGVRDLAKHVLTKKRIEMGLPTDGVLSNPAAAPSRSRTAAPVPDDTDATWNCPTCGGGNGLDRAECVYCGAARPGAAAVAAGAGAASVGAGTGTEASASAHAAFVNKVFLFNERNRDFLSGKRKTPVNLNDSYGCMVVFAGLFILIGLVIALFGVSEMQRYRALAANGVMTTAVVQDKSTSTDDDGTSYYITYTFTTSDNRTRSSTQSVSEGRYNRIEYGQRIDVLYDPGNPGNVRIDGTNDIGMSVGILAFAGFWELFCVVIFGAVLRGMWMQRRLVRRGVVLPGRIVQVESFEDSDDDFNIRVSFQARKSDGRWIDGHHSAVRNDLRHTMLPSMGRMIAVLYLKEGNMQPL